MRTVTDCIDERCAGRGMDLPDGMAAVRAGEGEPGGDDRRVPPYKKITLAGSVKWLENKPFDHRDPARLVAHRSRLPCADDSTPMVAVARSGCTAEWELSFGPGDLLGAWA